MKKPKTIKKVQSDYIGAALMQGGWTPCGIMAWHGMALHGKAQTMALWLLKEIQ
jgi:hypothetical protein